MASHLLSRKSCKKVYTLCQLCDDDDAALMPQLPSVRIFLRFLVIAANHAMPI